MDQALAEQVWRGVSRLRLLQKKHFFAWPQLTLTRLCRLDLRKDPTISSHQLVPQLLTKQEPQAGNLGLELVREVYKKYNILNFTSGNVGVQMGGWYRKEIKSVEDLKGLKIRIGGIGGMVLSKLGSVSQQIPASDIYSSLEKGTIDAAEWIGPYDDLKLGLNKVAPFYYAPGWFEGSASITTMVNDKAFAALPPAFQAAFEVACNEQTLKMLANYDAKNPDALHKLIGGGAKVSIFPRDVMDATYKASQELWVELSAKNPDFAKIFPQWQAFQQSEASWFRLAEASLDNYTYAAVGRR